MQQASKATLLIAFVFAAASSAHGAKSWDVVGPGYYPDPWGAPPPSYESYSPGPVETPGMSQLSPFDVFRPPTGPAPSRSDSMLRPWGLTRAPGARGTTTPPATDRYQPDLSGNWRGSAGERVEIRGNEARIWKDGQQSCYCIFMIHGNRMIAYSPDTDVVKKFEYSGGLDQFLLRDDQGGIMSFVRVR